MKNKNVDNLFIYVLKLFILLILIFLNISFIKKILNLNKKYISNNLILKFIIIINIIYNIKISLKMTIMTVDFVTFFTISLFF
jgi:hypothetical protein